MTDHLPHEIYETLDVSFLSFIHPLWLLILAALILAFVLWFLIKRKKQKIKIEVKLSLEERLKLTKPKEPLADYFFDLSTLVREYLNAHDLTTEEILEKKKDETQSVFLEFLIRSDKVKFAHSPSSLDEAQDWYEKITKVII